MDFKKFIKDALMSNEVTRCEVTHSTKYKNERPYPNYLIELEVGHHPTKRKVINLVVVDFQATHTSCVDFDAE